jgi:hypothetical protein
MAGTTLPIVPSWVAELPLAVQVVAGIVLFPTLVITLNVLRQLVSGNSMAMFPTNGL